MLSVTAIRGLIFAICATLIGGAWYWNQPIEAPASTSDRPKIRGAEYFTNRPLVTQDGDRVRFWDDLLRDRIVVVNFAYVSCPDLCSLSTARLAQLYEWLGDRVGRDIFFYTISIDPENDTPADLKAFAEAFDVGRGWTFLTGRPKDIDVIRHKMGERSRTLAEHRTDMVIGNARTGVWRRTSVMGSLKIAYQSVLELDPDWTPPAVKEPVGTLENNLSYDLAAHPGEAIFFQACASCHTIGDGERHAPDLIGVTLRREPEWLRQYLKQPDIVLARGDPTALALDAEYPSIRMPNLSLGDVDVDDLLAFFRASDRKLLANGTESEDDHDSHLGSAHHD